LPSRDIHLQLQKWAEQYGPIFSLIIGTKTLIVLSSPEVVKELLDRRSNIYSSRPDLYISQDLISGGYRMVLMKYDEKWRRIRKMMHSLLNVQAARTYVPYQMLENAQMLNDLLDTPDDFVNHMRRYSNSLTVSLVYGRRVPSSKDPDMLRLFATFEKFALATQRGSSALLDAYPVLQWIPVLPMVQYAKDAHSDELGLYMEHWLKVKEEIRNGTANSCFCVDMAGLQKDEGFSDEQAAYNAGYLFNISNCLERFWRRVRIPLHQLW
jgi:cytochrome P450